MNDQEELVRTIQGREYIAALTQSNRLLIQDFIRFPKIIPIEDPREVTAGDVEVLVRNGKHSSAENFKCGGFAEVTITGEDGFPAIVDDRSTAIGVHRAIFSDLVSHCVFSDNGGGITNMVTTRKSLPIGIAHISTSPRVVEAWKHRGQIGLYRTPSGHHDCAQALGRGITTELYDVDDATAAIHYSIICLGALKITLHGCDISVVEPRAGMITIDGRWLWPEQEIQVRSLHALCHVALRNDIAISYVDGSMIPVPGAAVIDRSSMEA